MLWIHDGCAIHFTRRERTHLEAMKARISIRSEELLGLKMNLAVEQEAVDYIDEGRSTRLSESESQVLRSNLF
jgi:hypothetical protein